jgi:NCAIR mutase (PurE)-related protein
VVALVAGGIISKDFISYIINELKPIVFIEIAISSACITIAILCIACALCSIVDFFVDSSVVSVAISVVISLTLGSLASITTWLGACINRVYCSYVLCNITSSLSPP